MFGVIPAALALESVTPPADVELMDRSRFFTGLNESKRTTWGRRLKRQWNLELTEARAFWFEGHRIVGVEVFRKNSEGRIYAIGDEVATEILGRAS